MNREANYYEILQINRSADAETVHRVYRFLAARYHPDNPGTGNTEQFLLLREAYDILSDPERRMRYDAAREKQDDVPLPVFGHRDFVQGTEQEANRRAGVLSLLYRRRRTSEARPGLSMLDLEKLMAIPREYLEFTLWYLRSKGYAALEGNSDLTITITGVDHVESMVSDSRIARELLWPLLANPGDEAFEEQAAA